MARGVSAASTVTVTADKANGAGGRPPFWEGRKPPPASIQEPAQSPSGRVAGMEMAAGPWVIG